MTQEKPIKPDKILKELSEIWSSMAKPDDTQAGDTSAQGGGVLRACAMTLISFVDDEEDSQSLNETLAGLMKEHPSRSVVVRLREGEDFLDARVFAQCWMPFGHRRQICCEQIEITSSMNRLADVAAIDNVSFALLRTGRPDLVERVKVIARTPSSPGLPFIASATFSPEAVATIRGCLFATLADPSLAADLATLGLEGAEVLDEAAYAEVADLERGAIQLGYPELA